jgi:hypothetical protein
MPAQKTAPKATAHETIPITTEKVKTHSGPFLVRQEWITRIDPHHQAAEKAYQYRGSEYGENGIPA